VELLLKVVTMLFTHPQSMCTHLHTSDIPTPHVLFTMTHDMTSLTTN